MGIHVRTKALKDGRQSLYLDFYPAVKGKDGKPTRREFLNRYLYSKPKNEVEKQINKENRLFAETVKLKRIKEILNEEDGIYNSSNKKKDFLEYFEGLAEKRNESQGNYGSWLSALLYLKDFSGDKCKMADLTEDFCNRFKEYLLNAKKLNSKQHLKLSQNSALSYFNKFRAAVNDAYNSRLLNENPLKYVKGIPEKESKREFLTQEELQDLVNTECESPLLKNAALFSALTGLRWSDIEKLTWNDIQQTETGYFLHIIQKKTQDVIMHPINNTAIQLLGKRGISTQKVFEGLVYSESNNNKLKLWVKLAKIDKKITLHNFRHTYATLMLNKGADIFTVSKMLGHKNIKTTMLYSKILSETKRNASNLVDFEL